MDEPRQSYGDRYHEQVIQSQQDIRQKLIVRVKFLQVEAGLAKKDWNGKSKGHRAGKRVEYSQSPLNFGNWDNPTGLPIVQDCLFAIK
jgi:hypothetical protein